jgi:predicted acyltransferase
MRLLSLDVFRGMTVALMILVNNPGDWSHVYAPLLHAKWNGCTPTDLVFPFFLFIVGVSIVLALSAKKESGAADAAIYGKILKRGAIIFGLGLLLTLYPKFNFATMRIPGVLQRIALVYMVCSVIYLNASWRTQIWLGVGILLTYWGLMTLVPVPGVGYANLEPATNLGAWLDNLLLNGHLWASSKVWDPEGLLSTMPAVGTGIIGMLTGEWLRTSRSHHEKLTGMFAVGAVLIFIGFAWDMIFPINKSLWTSSYVLYTGGLALQTLGMVYFLVDVLGWKAWAKPFLYYGMNALFIFVASGIFVKTLSWIKIGVDAAGKELSLQKFLYNSLFVPFLSPIHASLAWALANISLFLLVGWALYKNKIFVKV